MDHPFAIVVVHRFARGYLASCLEQAKCCNPKTPVILVGDLSNQSMSSDRFIAIDSLTETEEHHRFLKTYQHHSPWHSHNWERFCIERWFVVLAVMRQENLTRCLALDSDVLLFCDAEQESRTSQNAAVVFSEWDPCRVLPHCTYINERSALEEFCNYIVAAYGCESRLADLKKNNQKSLDRYWISDMSLWHAWASETKHSIQIRERAAQGQAIYDDCIESVNGFETSNPLPLLVRPWKRIAFINGLPFAFRRQTGEPVALRCIHYHGRFKALMERHSKKQCDGLIAALIILKIKCQDYPAKLRKAIKGYYSALQKSLAKEGIKSQI